MSVGATPTRPTSSSPVTVPPASLHLGHYAGSLRSRLALQGQCAQTLLIADLQALTDSSGRAADVAPHVTEVALDYLAVGIDPARTTIAVQSRLSALAELTVLYLNLVTVARLERNPTVKAEVELRGFERDIPAGFLCYPVSQAADITGVPRDARSRGGRPAPDDRADQRDRSAGESPCGRVRPARVSRAALEHTAPPGRRRPEGQQVARQRDPAQRHERRDPPTGAGDVHRPGSRFARGTRAESRGTSSSRTSMRSTRIQRPWTS